MATLNSTENNSNSDDEQTCITNISEEEKSTEQESLKTNIENNYYPQNGYAVSEHRLDAVARILLMGVYDDDHPLSIFRGMRYIIQKIWELVIQFNRQYYAQYIAIKDDPFEELGWAYGGGRKNADVAFRQIAYVKGCDGTYFKLPLFPQPLKKDININMMPIKMHRPEIQNQLSELTDELKGYAPLIEACLPADVTQRGKVCYLTIHESFVKKGHTQRRPGLHVEKPADGVGGESCTTGVWGSGYNQQDGIFMASNISNTCAVWNCMIIGSADDLRRDDEDEHEDENEEVIEDVMDRLGGCEHLRRYLPNDHRYTMEGGKLYWITDRTPHEALPMEKDGWRQFFRLVSSELSVWYEAHSTKNPLGIVPDPRITAIVKGNKFDV